MIILNCVGGHGGEMQWYFSSLKGSTEEDATEG